MCVRVCLCMRVCVCVCFLLGEILCDTFVCIFVGLCDSLASAFCSLDMDALLGAAGLPDIGVFFPNTDPQFKGISSVELLKRVWDEVRKEGFLLGNLDITVLAEAPKVSPHVAAMKNTIAAAIDSDISQIAIKATTMERLGFVGRREGIAAMAVALLVAE